MPFGLCNAPATFQRLMERCLDDLNLKDCLIYVDYIIIFSKDIDSHIERLDKKSEGIASYNLKLKPSKSEWPVPRNVKEARKFLRFIAYYRRFIEGFASIARPSNDLLVGLTTVK